MKFEEEVTTMDCLLSAKGESDFIAIGFADGKVSIVNRFGKVDKTIQDAHKGSITSIKWSHDGQTICSTGEDGTVKIWSKSGMLRTELLTLE
jgi:intraflagellar transport protein 80